MMTEQDSLFRGKAVSARILSNCISYGPRPAKEDEVEQHLILSADGTIDFSSFLYGDGAEYLPVAHSLPALEASCAQEILDALADGFSRPAEELFLTDAGIWSLTLTNEEGRMFHYDGSLCALSPLQQQLSRLVRERLGLPGLMVFDGCAESDRIEMLVLDVRRTLLKAGSSEAGLCTEHISLDRCSRTLHAERCIEGGIRDVRELTGLQAVPELLDQLPLNLLDGVPAVPQDAGGTRLVTLTLLPLHSEPRLAQIPLHSESLPPALSALFRQIRELLSAQPLPDVLFQ